ncbi:MAG: hypothetical protein JST86_09785 [Bacteroidetes bacterium]|nr:hypothetical protein [Bacteroidota bacterium]
MLSAEQIQQIVAENESLQVQLQEANFMLALREKQIAELKEKVAAGAELRSMVDMQLDELNYMQDHIGLQQRRAAGAEDRELELQHELTQAARLQKEYADLFQQYTYINTQLEDLQKEIAKLRKRNNMLQQIAVKIGEVESNMELLTMERDELKAKLSAMESL